MDELLLKINPSMWYIIGALFAVIVVMSILKNAIKMAIFIGILAISFVMLGPKATEMQNQYGVDYDEGVVSITIDGQTTNLNANDLKDIKIEENEDGNHYILYMYRGEENSMKIPSYMVGFTTSKIESITKDLQ